MARQRGEIERGWPGSNTRQETNQIREHRVARLRVRPLS